MIAVDTEWLQYDASTVAAAVYLFKTLQCK